MSVTKRARRGEAQAPIEEDPVIKSIDLTSKSQIDNDTIYEALSASIYEMKETLVQEFEVSICIHILISLDILLAIRLLFKDHIL